MYFLVSALILSLNLPKKVQAIECFNYLTHPSSLQPSSQLSNYEHSHYSLDPQTLNERELSALFSEMTPPDDFEWFESLLENPNLVPFISKPTNGFYNENIHTFAVWLTKTEHPNIYIHALFKSELWMKINVQNKNSFAIELITNMDPSYIFAKEVLRFFSTLVNIPNYFYMTSLWMTAFEKNQKQLLSYFMSLPHFNLTQMDRIKDPDDQKMESSKKGAKE